MYRGKDDTDPLCVHTETRTIGHRVNGRLVGDDTWNKTSGLMEADMLEEGIVALGNKGLLPFMVGKRGGGACLDLDAGGRRAVERGWKRAGMAADDLQTLVDPGHGTRSPVLLMYRSKVLFEMHALICAF
jgi:hypothetical protein